MVSLRDITEAYKQASISERKEFIDTILPELEESPIFKNAIETVFLTSDLRPVKRISQLESTVFAKNEDGDIIIKDNKPVLSPELTAKAPEPAQKETEPMIPLKTTLEKKAVAFAEWLFKKPYSPTGIIQADDKEIKEFINDELDEKLRGKDKSDRKIKMRIINKAKELYPGRIEINKNPNGRHKTSVFVKNSFQSERTVRTPLFLAGEMF